MGVIGAQLGTMELTELSGHKWVLLKLSKGQ